ncbi:MAG: Holliday junction branch migration protein RuvA [Micavibrio aeruginosavorus]|uniref:Holliday junction branch migration complex subunit RuvA n=1 Tax=Micavibrio aeruginosavorus TaxID=349221 RepID=A0A7T5UGL6_9BACT|nr:MAG: Holliday junction branch migration protein RuvA [Micavibrio aeruginosavorus]
MIAKLSGIMDSAGQDYLILDVNGVGYQVFASGRTLSRVQKGEPLSLLIDTHVREDHIHLYGFMDKAEQEWFRLLTSVQGVGAKVGMAILSACPVDRLGFAIAAGDAAFVRQADGVGPKLATRIVTELKDKAAKIDLAPSSKPQGQAPTKTIGQFSPADVESDAVSALVNLGYGRADAYSAVLQVRGKANDNLSEILKLALKELGS